MNKLFPKSRRTYALIGIFGIAMGLLEAVVVVYLRQLYYPEGFSFPLYLLPPKMLFLEWIREMATITMLVAIGSLAGKNRLQKFSYFLFTFAVWDIIYYVGLKLMLNWPPSFLTWDILFLIPVAWIGPVLAPVICSLSMIFFSMSIAYLQERGYKVHLKFFEWSLVLLGSFIIFCTFIWDYFTVLLRESILSGFQNLANNAHFNQIIAHYKPTYFHWYLFTLGEVLILGAIVLMLKRTKSTLPPVS